MKLEKRISELGDFLIKYGIQSKVHKNQLMGFLIKNDVSFNLPDDEFFDENSFTKNKYDAVVKIYNIGNLSKTGLEFFESLKKSPKKNSRNKKRSESSNKKKSRNSQKVLEKSNSKVKIIF